MERDPKLDAIVRLGGQIDRLEQKARELREDLSILASEYKRRTGSSASVDELIQQADETKREIEKSSKPAPRQRKSRFPEGPPLNRRIMDFLRKQEDPCGYQDILTEVEAHHQSILNALRDLEKRRLAARLAPNQWIATDTKGGLRLLKQS